MARKKSYLSLLPKSARDEVEVILRERDGALTFPDLVARHWDLRAIWRGPFSTEAECAETVEEERAALAAIHPAWAPGQVDDAIRLQHVARHLRDIAIARRCALDDPGELARLLTACHRLERAALSFNRPEPEEVCALGDIPLAQQFVAGRTAGFTAIISQEYLHSDAVYALLQRNQEGFERLVGQIPRMKPRHVGRWLEGIYVALKGVVDNRPDEVARGLTLHIAGLHKTPQKPELDGAVKLQAHGLYRLFEWVSPGLVSEFDPAQPFPWDAPFHAWVSAHPDPAAGWDLSGTPPLVQQVVGRGELPDWLVPVEKPRYEIVLLGGDPRSRPLLEEIEGEGGGDGSLSSARRMLAHCPVVLRWGFEEEDRDYLEDARRRIQAVGGQAEVRPMRPSAFRHFVG